MPMTDEEQARFDWLMNEVARLRAKVEGDAATQPSCSGCDGSGYIERRSDVGDVPCPACNPLLPTKQPRKPDDQRTVAEVLASREGCGSCCCNTWADQCPCDCLEVAKRYEAALATSGWRVAEF